MAKGTHTDTKSLEETKIGEQTLMELLTGEQSRESVSDVERSTRSGRQEVEKAMGQSGLMGLSIKDFSTRMVSYALDLDELNDEHKHLASEWDTRLSELKNWQFGMYKAMYKNPLLKWLGPVREAGREGVERLVSRNGGVLDSIFEQTVRNFIGARDRVAEGLEELKVLHKQGEKHYEFLETDSLKWREESGILEEEVTKAQAAFDASKVEYTEMVTQLDAMVNGTKEKEDFALDVTMKQGDVNQLENILLDTQRERQNADEHLRSAENSKRAQEATLSNVKALVMSYEMMKIGYDAQIRHSMPIFQQQAKVACATMLAEEVITVYQQTMGRANEILMLNAAAARAIALESMKMLAEPFWDEEKVETVKKYSSETIDALKRFQDAYHLMSQKVFVEKEYILNPDGLATEPMEMDEEA